MVFSVVDAEVVEVVDVEVETVVLGVVVSSTRIRDSMKESAYSAWSS